MRRMRQLIGIIVDYSAYILFAVAVGLVVSLQAQEQAPAAPDPSKEIAALKQQIAQLQQKTPAELTKAAQDGYASIFKEAKEKANPGCKAAGGHLRVTVASDGKASVSCEL